MFYLYVFTHQTKKYSGNVLMWYVHGASIVQSQTDSRALFSNLYKYVNYIYIYRGKKEPKLRSLITVSKLDQSRVKVSVGSTLAATQVLESSLQDAKRFSNTKFGCPLLAITLSTS